MTTPSIRILYVEDEPFLARVVKESLESRNFDVLLESDGSKVLEAFRKYQPHICVLDVMLPGVDGFSLASEIKLLAPAMPVIFLTARTQTKDLLKGFESGGNDYLRKPFSMEELIVRIQNLLRLATPMDNNTANGKNPEAIFIGTYIFNPHQYELQHSSQTRKLSLRETRLLSLLTHNLGQPVLRQDILLELWGDDSFYNSRNLDVYISRLRDYLSADPSIQIVTLKGIGYRVQVQNPNNDLPIA